MQEGAKEAAGIRKKKRQPPPQNTTYIGQSNCNTTDDFSIRRANGIILVATSAKCVNFLTGVVSTLALCRQDRVYGISGKRIRLFLPNTLC